MYTGTIWIGDGFGSIICDESLSQNSRITWKSLLVDTRVLCLNNLPSDKLYVTLDYM